MSLIDEVKNSISLFRLEDKIEEWSRRLINLRDHTNLKKMMINSSQFDYKISESMEDWFNVRDKRTSMLDDYVNKIKKEQNISDELIELVDELFSMESNSYNEVFNTTLEILRYERSAKNY